MQDFVFMKRACRFVLLLFCSVILAHLQFLHGGDVLWMAARISRRVVDFLGTHSSFLLISFTHKAPRPAAP